MYSTKIARLMALLTVGTSSWATLPLKDDDVLGNSVPPPGRSHQPAGTAFVNVSTPDDQFWGITDRSIEQLFATSADLICIMDQGGHFVRLNKQWEIILGYDQQELKNQPYINFVHPKDVDKTLQFEQAGATTGLVNRYRRKSGSYRWLDWIGIPNVSKQAYSNHQFAIARDVTLNKLYEKNVGQKIKLLALEDNQSKAIILEAVAEVQTSQLADLLDNSTADDNKRTLKVALQHFIHLSRSDYGFISEVFYTPDQQPYFNLMWQAGKQASQSNQDNCSNNNQTDPQNNVFEGFMRQVVQERQPLFINDFQTFQQQQAVTVSYQGIKSFFGIPLLSQGELIGVVGLSQQSLVGVVGLVDRAEPYTPELLEWLKPLTVITGRLTGEAKGQRHCKDLLAEQQKNHELAETNRLKSLFIAHMSHEIRTPLMGIMGHLDLIDKRLVSKEVGEQIDNAQISAKSLLHISNDVLDISRIEAGMFRLDDKVFNLTQIVQETLDILKIDTDTKKLALNLQIDHTIPSTLQGDPMRLRQILFNLVNNAVKFTHQGRIDVHFIGQTNTELPAEFTLKGKVTDTGIGIHANNISRLFQPFSQEDQSIYRQFGGTGLGLYITQQLCMMMKGNISVSSQHGLGSAFMFDVQLAVPNSNNNAIAPISEVLELPPLNILVVEDNLMNQKILKGLLTRLKCTVTLAHNGQEGVNMIKQAAIKNTLYDVVLMDGEMPVMNGLEATRQIRTDSRFDQLPIIGVTAHAMLDHREVFLAAGMNGYLTKPVIKNDLIAEIKKHLNLTIDQQINPHKRKLDDTSSSSTPPIN